MSSQAGWYPDPGGQPGLYRFWDGRAWSAATTNNPSSAPPPQGLGQSAPQAQQGQGHNPYAPQGGRPQQGAGGPQGGGMPPTPKRTPWGWWIGALAVLLVVVIAVSMFVRGVIRNAGGGDDPGGQSTTQVCPTGDSSPDPSAQPPNDGRVHGGALSYPMLPSPWEAPSFDDRVPFGRDTVTQNVMVHANYDGQGNSWVASVLVGELIAGDGFFTPEQGSEIVVRCVTGRFYGDGTVVNRDDQENKAMKVDGKDAWIVKSHLTFDIAGLPTKGETLIVVIVASGEATSSLYYASIPDDSPEYLPVAEQLISQLKVDS